MLTNYLDITELYSILQEEIILSLTIDNYSITTILLVGSYSAQNF